VLEKKDFRALQKQPSPNEPPSDWLLRSVRGATSVEVDTPEAHQTAVSALLLALVEANNIKADDICTVFFTLTDDLHAISPAKVARQTLPWQHVALFTSVEPTIVGLPTMIIRVLIQFYSTLNQQALTHLYQNKAALLRPDRCGDPTTTSV
jgi:chorismate mutase